MRITLGRDGCIYIDGKKARINNLSDSGRYKSICETEDTGIPGERRRIVKTRTIDLLTRKTTFEKVYPGLEPNTEKIIRYEDGELASNTFIRTIRSGIDGRILRHIETDLLTGRKKVVHYNTDGSVKEEEI